MRRRPVILGAEGGTAPFGGEPPEWTVGRNAVNLEAEKPLDDVIMYPAA